MASGIAFAAHIGADRQKAAVPVSSWFQTDEFFVADAASGANPTLSARFLVLDEFEYFWVSEVQRLAGDTRWITVCSSAGQAVAQPAMSQEFSWRDVTAPSCALPPGQYRLKMTFVLARPGWQPKRLPVTSNSFSVGGSDG